MTKSKDCGRPSYIQFAYQISFHGSPGKVTQNSAEKPGASITYIRGKPGRFISSADLS